MNLAQRSLLVAVVALGAYLPHLGASQHTETMNPESLKPGPIRHTALPPNLLKRAIALEPVFADVYPVTHEKWIEGFRRDAHPENEIAIWEQIAAAYTQFIKDRQVPIAQRREAFGLLLYRSGATAEETLQQAKLKHLTREEARRLVNLYKANPEPITAKKR